MTNIGETTSLIPQAGSSTLPEHLQDGGSGDTDFPYGNFKPIATIGEADPETGDAMTGYPDGQAAWLLDEDTVRVAYQSESYATLTSSAGETYPWVMENGVEFTGSHVHTIDYDRTGMADFLNNDQPASEIFEDSGHLFDTVYNVFGEIVDGKNDDPTDLGAKWGNQVLADGTLVEFDSGPATEINPQGDQRLTQGDWFFHSFCGAYYEQANKYGEGIGFEDDMWLMSEEWNIGQLFDEAAAAAGITEDDARIDPGRDFFTTTMGLASMVVDIENETAYTAPALGQTGYEKILPINPGSEDYVVLVMAGYNLEVEPQPLTIYVGKKGVDENNEPLADDASERDSFLGRNGLLYGQLYGMALDDATYAELGIENVDADEFMMDAYAVDADAPENFTARYYPTSYQWEGFDNPVNANETEMFRWEQDGDDGEPNEQPEGHTYFNGDSKTEHPAVDPDPTKHRYIQNLTVPSAQLGIEFSNIEDELVNNDADGNDLPDYLSADVTRILAGVDGELTLETGLKGAGHIGEENPDGILTHSIHIEAGEARMNQPDGLQWVKASDGDFLIVDEDSGNDAGERKYILPIDGETLQLEEPGTGYFLASAGGNDNPRVAAEVEVIEGTFSPDRSKSSEFSGTWNMTHLLTEKEDGSFYTQEEIAGMGAQDIIGSIPLAEQTFLGVVQHRAASGGIVEERQADQGGQVFLFNVSEPLESRDPVIGETTALIPQAGSSTLPEHLEDGGSGDTDFPFGDFKPLATVGEIDPETGDAMTGYPDGQAAWLADEDTVRVAYQSESYATLSSSAGETYPWVMENGVEFTGSHIHTIDYDRAGFADFLNNETPASEIFEDSGHIFDNVYNVFGEVVDGKNADPTDLSAKWGNQVLADGTLVEFDSDQQLTQGDWFFHSFCGAYYEQANKYGEGIGFEDDIFTMSEEWNIGELFDEAAADAGITEDNARLDPGRDFALTTMGLASMVVDVENETAYTAPALGQTGYEKILPINPGSEDYVVLVMAGYNMEVEPQPMTIYVGRKGVDANGDPLTDDASERDSFLGRNGLLYGQLYGMALDGDTYADLGIDNVDVDEFMMDAYAVDADAPENFSARYYPTSYQWEGFDNPVNVNETEMFLWEQDGDDGEANEQPGGGVEAGGFTYFSGDSKTEHPAVDPDPTKHRFVQNLTVPSAQLGVEFNDILNELEGNDEDGNGLPDFLSVDVTRTLAGVDGELRLETGGKGLGHQSDDLNPDGTLTHEIHIEAGEARMNQPDGLQWVKAADGDFLIVDEDSGNDAGERKYVLPIDGETLQLEEPGTGYFLASAGGNDNPRVEAQVEVIEGTFAPGRSKSSEFSGSWNVTHLVETKEDGSFYTQEEIAGMGAQEIIGTVPLADQTFIGVVQHRAASGGVVAENLADQGGQIFQFNIDLEGADPPAPSPGAPAFGSLEADTLEVGVDFDGVGNLVFAGAGEDTVEASTGDGGNRVYGGSDNDELTAGSFDRLFGGEGDDILESSLGRENRVYGGAGNDTIVAGYEDRILGGEGDDAMFLSEGEVEGGGGNIVTGGPGADQFWIANAQLPGSASTITDFIFGEDVLGIGGIDGVTELADLTIAPDGDNAVVSVGDDDLAILLGVDANALEEDAANFAIQESAV